MSASDLATLVKQAVDIVDVIGHSVSLRRSGNRYLGLCPFHQEKTPSFQVDAENQFYHCFGCGSGGDVLSFVMKQQNLSFAEALKYLADRYHIALPQSDHTSQISGAMAERTRKEREELYRVLEVAAEFFYSQLHHSPAGKLARDYCLKRALPPDLVESERLGYAPERWDALTQHLKQRGIAHELGIRAGLLGMGGKDRVYDRFRNRLIFPIADEHGRIVAFGGRSLSEKLEKEPKYLNSPETPVYHKGRMLYQTAKARQACRQVRQLVVVEGYMDLLAFHARGFQRVVATLGTAVTSLQVRLVSRFSDEAVLAYDGDEAGEKAMLRALPLFLQEQLAVSCVRFPETMDPDDFLKREGLAGFEALLGQRVELGIYAIRRKLEEWDGSVGGKTRVLAELQPLIGAARQPLLRAEYLRVIADRLSVSEAVIRNQLQFLNRQSGRSSAPARPISLPRQLHAAPAAGLEESVLRAMIKYPALIDDVRNSKALDCFQRPQLKAIAEILIQVASTPVGNLNASLVYDRLSDTAMKELFTRFLLESRDLSKAEVHLRDWLEALCERKTKQERLNLREALHRAEKEGDTIQVKRLLALIQDHFSGKIRAKDTPDNV